MSPTNDQPQTSWLLAKIAQAALALAGISLIGMVLVEGWQVIARYVLNDSPSWTEPVVLLQINIAMMFSAAVGIRNGAHFGFRVFVDRAAPGLRRVMKVFAHSVTVLIGALLSWGGVLMMMDTWSVKLPGASLRQGMLYMPLAVGGALIVVFAIEQMLSELINKNNNAVDRL
jgi:TRAP-type C4-dicarboxylate transport system permease small subunit